MKRDIDLWITDIAIFLFIFIGVVAVGGLLMSLLHQ